MSHKKWLTPVVCVGVSAGIIGTAFSLSSSRSSGRQPQALIKPSNSQTKPSDDLQNIQEKMNSLLAEMKKLQAATSEQANKAEAEAKKAAADKASALTAAASARDSLNQAKLAQEQVEATAALCQKHSNAAAVSVTEMNAAAAESKLNHDAVESATSAVKKDVEAMKSELMAFRMERNELHQEALKVRDDLTATRQSIADGKVVRSEIQTIGDRVQVNAEKTATDRQAVAADLVTLNTQIASVQTAARQVEQSRTSVKAIEQRLVADVRRFNNAMRAQFYFGLGQRIVVAAPYDALDHVSYTGANLDQRKRISFGLIGEQGHHVLALHPAEEVTHVYSLPENKKCVNGVEAKYFGKGEQLVGDQLFYIDGHGDIASLDMITGEVDWMLTKQFKQQPDETPARFAVGGSRIAIAFTSGRIAVVENQELIESFSLGKDPDSLTMSEDGSRLAAIVQPKIGEASVQICDVKTQTILRITRDGLFPKAVALHQSGQVAIGYHDGSFGIWDAAGKESRFVKVAVGASEIRDLNLTEDAFGELTLVTVDDAMIRIFDAQEGRLLADMPCYGGKLPAVMGVPPKVLAVCVGKNLDSFTILNDLGLVFQISMKPTDLNPAAPQLTQIPAAK